MNDREINYTLASTELEARHKGLEWLMGIEGIPHLESGYDINLYVVRQKSRMWNWKVMMLPKSQHKMIYPDGGFYSGREPYSPSRDFNWGAYEEIPCIEVTDRKGNIVEYAAFQMPDKCSRCPFRDAQKLLEACARIPVCSKDNVPCGKKIAMGCTDFPDECIKWTDQEQARKDLEMWEEIDRRGITLEEYLKEKRLRK